MKLTNRVTYLMKIRGHFSENKFYIKTTSRSITQDSQVRQEKGTKKQGHGKIFRPCQISL